MILIWKLLKSHISIPQFVGFFLANLLGMTIVLLGLQFYRDVKPAFSQEDSFLKAEYMVVSKHVAATGILGVSTSGTFSPEEIEDLRHQPFCHSVGAFTASQYKVSCSLGMDGLPAMGTEMFFESVPDGYVDTDLDKWHFSEQQPEIPIILPRTYLAIYNFGFAQSQSLPKISEGVVEMLDLDVRLRGAGRDETLKAHVVGFSSRLNTILVPQDFIQWSNARYAPESNIAPSRLIVEVANPTDDAIATYMQQHGYELEDDKLDAGRATFFLKLVFGIVVSVGLLISLLSFYILMLSVYLLVQKNTEKLRNLLLIGYSPSRISLPYQLLTVGMNACVLLIAFVITYVIRGFYMHTLWTMFPQMQESTMGVTLCVGLGLFVLVCLINVLAIRSKIINLVR